MDLSSSAKVARHLMNKINLSDAEEFWVFALNPQCRLIESRMLFRGTVDQCFFHPRDIFRFAILHNASAIVVGHNHPSGCCQPSLQDQKLTNQLMRLGRFLQIPVIDHVIIGQEEKSFYSFKLRASQKMI